MKALGALQSVTQASYVLPTTNILTNIDHSESIEHWLYLPSTMMACKSPSAKCHYYEIPTFDNSKTTE